MNRKVGIVLLTLLNIITSLATVGLLLLFLGLGDIAFTELMELGIGFIVFLVFYIAIEIIKWTVYIFILIRRREKLRYYFIAYGLLVVFISLFFRVTIPVFIGLLYFLAIYLLKEEKITRENDYLLFDEKPENDKVKSSHDIPFIIGLTLLVIVSFYMTWTSIEAAMTVISYNLKLGIVPLLYLTLSVILSIVCWISLYSVINNRQSNWRYYFAGLLVFDVIYLIWRTIELSQFEYFTSIFMLLDPVRIFMLTFNFIGFLLIIRKEHEVKEEVDH